MDNNYYNTNEYADFIDNFHKLYEACIRLYIDNNKKELKWVIIHLYMSLQSTFILSLRTTNNGLLQKNKTSKKYLINRTKYSFQIDYSLDSETYVIDKITKTIFLNFSMSNYHDIKSILDELNEKGFKINTNETINIYNEINKLNSFMELYKRVKSKKYMSYYYNSKPLPTRIEFNNSIDLIIEFRNKFIHFMPKTWSIEYSDMFTHIKNSLNIIKFLLYESNTILDLLDAIKQSTVENELFDLENRMKVFA
jgi:hypothetical protein